MYIRTHSMYNVIYLRTIAACSCWRGDTAITDWRRVGDAWRATISGVSGCDEKSCGVMCVWCAMA